VRRRTAMSGASGGAAAHWKRRGGDWAAGEVGQVEEVVRAAMNWAQASWSGGACQRRQAQLEQREEEDEHGEHALESGEEAPLAASVLRKRSSEPAGMDRSRARCRWSHGGTWITVGC